MKKFAVFAAAVAATLALSPLARASSEQQQAVDEATTVIEHIGAGHDDITAEARKLLHHARGVLIVPELVKGGFFFGAQGGTGVLVSRNEHGWSDPAFYAMGAGSFGLQIGVEVSKVVLIVMNEHALESLLNDKVKLGAEAGLAVATLGAGAEADTTTHGGADIYVIAESKGLFGGIAVEGGYVGPRHEWDTAYYGPHASTRDIILRRTVTNPGADHLKQALGAI